MKKILQRLTLVAASTMSMFSVAGEGEVLVILSSETTMDLADGQSIETGYYLNEFGVPAKALVDAGYELVLATPKGNAPQVDKKSVSTDYFDGNEAKMQSIQRFVASLPDIKDTASLSEILAGDLSQYEAVFIPGGHAPLIDLANNPEVGEILRHFNKQGKPTAAICHGPITLLSAQVQPNSYYQAIKDGEKASANNWIYDGYKMTIFSDPEERVFESSLEGKKLKFYPAMAMEKAGGNMAFASEWQPNVVVDRELITGQNPFSDKLLAEKLLEMLAK
ncbi:type 1 glutamine amidotransferase domain-containing protein [Pseudoalteromonas shioyasakiensis]|uniref:Type 1 glutamine amidotransferase domain-containing protein n=1 Tax=Pseudoalteromonas shioyasakiensis TaxID=1190813 RepID=A0ABT6U1N5_9GAMM|nr:MULTISPECIES: type 1 glutamine amidotransferase domain-containing protein [Pseudoalteromonas]MDI4669940.1 type 1 glutamine amidotransferase domain-containing protein [Pseudoalteromonas shioyasakiensis]MDI4675131.1 type 1 glutamine amidotransferase domain-containing protein [Pseudoalteromonas shioyasakiensis]MDI4687150.1 type 1 glutamine amidotransferase domain-containing protein [Pseudoalteromonas shioyasakiensis]MDI4705745.1 type 1 glutamine amidotransferase domain-containing protein [Pseud